MTFLALLDVACLDREDVSVGHANRFFFVFFFFFVFLEILRVP